MIVTVELDDIKFEYVKECQIIVGKTSKYLYAQLTLLIIAILVIIIAVRQEQFKFIQESGEGEVYEIQTISIKQTLGILVIASSVLSGFYFMVKYFSLIWLITIFFLFSISFLLIPFFVEFLENYAKGNVKSI
mmetsp:Transcript_22783/g.25324  ORF Transcript_22783/g.25324 Transcript_22783/m.25324 type:complete len:133 (-) Transcript_22783:66-464(-)